MKTLLTFALVAMLCHVALSDNEGPRGDGDRMGGPPPPKGSRQNTDKVEGSEGENDQDGKYRLKNGGRSFDLILKGYAELDAAGNAVEGFASHNKTGIVNNPPAEEDLPFSQKEDGAEGERVQGKCLTGMVTFDSNTNVETKCCIAKDNGTITLDPNNANGAEQLSVERGYGKCAVLVSDHTWSDTGAKLRLDYVVKSPKGGRPSKKGRGPEKDGKKQPKVYDFGDAMMFLATKVAVLVADDPNNVETWLTMDDADADLENGEDGEVRATFILPKPTDAAKKLWYDPAMALEEVYDDSSAPQMAAAMLTTLVCLLTVFGLY